MHIYCSVTDAIHPFSVVSVVEDLTCDWLDTQAFQTYLRFSQVYEFDCNLVFLCKIVFPVF